MQLAARPRRNDELHLLDIGSLDADSLGLTAEHPHKLRERPPRLVAVAELVRGSAWEGHCPGSDIGLVDAAITRMGDEVLGETRFRLIRRTLQQQAARSPQAGSSNAHMAIGARRRAHAQRHVADDATLAERGGCSLPAFGGFHSAG